MLPRAFAAPTDTSSSSAGSPEQRRVAGPAHDFAGLSAPEPRAGIVQRMPFAEIRFGELIDEKNAFSIEAVYPSHGQLTFVDRATGKRWQYFAAAAWARNLQPVTGLSWNDLVKLHTEGAFKTYPFPQASRRWQVLELESDRLTIKSGPDTKVVTAGDWDTKWDAKTTSQGLSEAVFPRLPVNLWDQIVRQMDPAEMWALRVASKTHKRLVDRILIGLSGLHPLSSFSGPMLGQIQKHIDLTVDRIRIATDRVDISRANELLLHNEHLKSIVEINYGQELMGTPKPTGGIGITEERVHERRGPTRHETSKMHNKLILQGGTDVMTGSPNITSSGLTQNTESMIFIRNPLIAYYFNRYVDLVSSGTKAGSKRGKAFGESTEAFNRENTKIRLALAPFNDIRRFVQAELQGADRVVVRMFVIGLWKDDTVVDTLCHLQQAGCNVTVVVDAGQHATEGYVQSAVEELLRWNVEVVLQEAPGGKGIMHDKMILAHFPEALGTPEGHRVMVGSSGFTRNVYEGMNYENMVSIDDAQLYKYFMEEHHEKSLAEAPSTTL